VGRREDWGGGGFFLEGGGGGKEGGEGVSSTGKEEGGGEMFPKGEKILVMPRGSRRKNSYKGSTFIASRSA